MIGMLPDRVYLMELLSQLMPEAQLIKNLQNICTLCPQNFSLLTLENTFQAIKIPSESGVDGY